MRSCCGHTQKWQTTSSPRQQKVQQDGLSGILLLLYRGKKLARSHTTSTAVPPDNQKLAIVEWPFLAIELTSPATCTASNLLRSSAATSSKKETESVSQNFNSCSTKWQSVTCADSVEIDNNSWKNKGTCVFLLCDVPGPESERKFSKVIGQHVFRACMIREHLLDRLTMDSALDFSLEINATSDFDCCRELGICSLRTARVNCRTPPFLQSSWNNTTVTPWHFNNSLMATLQTLCKFLATPLR